MMNFLDAVKIGGGIAVASLGWFAYDHYRDLVRDREEYRVQTERLLSAVETERQATQQALEGIEEWKRAYETLTEDISELATATRAARNETRRLQRMFSEHDLNRLALERPDLVIARINAGSSRINRLLECASGSADQQCASQDRSPE